MRKIRENFYRSVALNILNTIKTFNTTNRTSRFLFEDNCNSSKNPSSVIHNYTKKKVIFLFEISYFIISVHMFVKDMKDNNNITCHGKMHIKKKMLEKENQNNSYPKYE